VAHFFDGLLCLTGRDLAAALGRHGGLYRLAGRGFRGGVVKCNAAAELAGE